MRLLAACVWPCVTVRNSGAWLGGLRMGNSPEKTNIIFESSSDRKRKISAMAGRPSAAAGSVFLVVAQHALDLVARAQYHSHALMQGAGGDVQDALVAVDGRAARLLDDVAHGVGLVHETQLAL